MSSISDAISKQRPDLNKQTRFQRHGNPAAEEKTVVLKPIEPPAGFSAGASMQSAAGHDSGPETPRGWFGVPWLATTRSRALLVLLTGLCLGIGVGYFPRLGDVRGVAEEQTAELASAAGASVHDLANAEIDAWVDRTRIPAATAAPNAAAPVDSVDASAQSAESAPEKVMVVSVQPKSEPGEPTMIVQVQVSAKPAMAGEASDPPDTSGGGWTGLAGVTPAGTLTPDGPPVQEVLFEALPSPQQAPATTADATRAQAPRTGAAGTSGAEKVEKKSRPAPKPVVLSGIFWDEAQPMAMINGEIFEVGDSVDGAEILEIRPESVVVRQNGERRSLRL
jgi:hypothetical protein